MAEIRKPQGSPGVPPTGRKIPPPPSIARPAGVKPGVPTPGQKVQSPVNTAPAATRQPGQISPAKTAIAAQKQEVTTIAKAKKKKRFSLPFFGGVSSKQLTQFTAQFAVLIDAGLPLVRTLKILEDQQPEGKFKDVISDIRLQVEAGTSVCDALATHPEVFDKLYIYTVKAGEKSGTLDVIMKRLADFMEKSQRLKRKIISASTYPAVVISAAILIVAGLMVKVVPKFKDVLTGGSMGGGLGQNAKMPAMTQFLLNTSETMAANWYFVLAIPVVLFIVYKILNKKPSTKFVLDKFKMKIPIVGEIIRKTSIVRFTRTLGTLLASAVPILEALDIIKNAIGNEVFAKAVQDVQVNLKEGEAIAPVVKSTGLFGDFVYNMIQVGEETGELDKMLMKVADAYDEEVDAAVTALTGVIEPILIIFIAVVIGFIVVALFMPLLTIMQSMSTGL